MNLEPDYVSRCKPVATFWYGIQPVTNDIVWLREIYVDNFSVGDSWIVRGADIDLVIDTCSGIVPLAPVIESICSKPVLAVALNDSYDHCGGWSGFDNRACHPAYASGLLNPMVNDETVFDYLDDDRFKALPYEGYSARDYEMTGAAPTRLLSEGEVIDIGGRSIEVLYTPGRGEGAISLWEEATGSLFTSDILYDGEHGLAWPPSHPRQYMETLQRFLDLPVSTVYPGHYGLFNGDQMNELINEQISDLKQRI